jgi:hypothetical protein
LDATHRRLVYDLRFDGGSRELQLALKLTRLVRKISWWVNPSRRRKWSKKKVAAQAGVTIFHETPTVSMLGECLDSALITLAVHGRNREMRDRQIMS